MLPKLSALAARPLSRGGCGGGGDIMYFRFQDHTALEMAKFRAETIDINIGGDVV